MAKKTPIQKAPQAPEHIADTALAGTPTGLPPLTATLGDWHQDMMDHIRENNPAALEEEAPTIPYWASVAERRKAHNSREAVAERAKARETTVFDSGTLDSVTLETAAVDMVREARAVTQVVTHAELDAIARIGQMVGVARHAQFMEATNRVIWLKSMQELKKTGEYKNLPMQSAKGELVRPKNFAELCEAMGTSRSKVDEDINNMNVFGGVLLEEQKRLGISYPELRAMRAGMQALPEEKQREAKDIIETAARSGDKEELLAALSEMGVYNITLSKERDAALAQVEAQQKVQSKTAKRANELEIKLEQALNPGSEDDRQQNLNESRTALRAQLDSECNATVGIITTLCNHIMNVRKADTEGKGPGLGEEVIDAALWEHINSRVSTMCQTLRALMLDTGLEVDFSVEFTGELSFDDVDGSEASDPKQARQ